MKRELDALEAREHDLIVVGGGVLGAAACWDATQRGLRVALIEGSDFCSGTSWNSLKTIHGGLRYLQKLDFPRMRQSIADRRALLRIAPDLVRPLPFVVAAYGHGRRGREALGLGLAASDLIAFDRNRGLAPDHAIPGSRRLSRDEVLALIPGVERRGLTGGAQWHDAQVVSSERLVMAFLLEASREGAAVANYVEVTGFRRDGGRITGVVARDLEGEREITVRAPVVLAAVGPWTEGLLSAAGLRPPTIPLLRAINVVLQRPPVSDHAFGGFARGRFLFMVPWRDQTLLGTAYEPDGEGSPGGTVDGLLADAQIAFPWAAPAPAEVSLVHHGLVPGTADAGGLWTRDLLRDHATDGAPGLLSVVGVKFTTARAVAQSAVDLVFRRLGRRSPRCRTAETTLGHARELSGELGERVRHAVTSEMAVHVDDAVLRRLDLGTGGPLASEEIEAGVREMAALAGWSEERVREERARLEARFRLGREG
jgi:glycerol-3-phosphate dehydrogenase